MRDWRGEGRRALLDVASAPPSTEYLEPRPPLDVDERVGQIGVLEVALAHERSEPGVSRLRCVAEHPAGQPHRDALGGQSVMVSSRLTTTMALLLR